MKKAKLSVGYHHYQKAGYTKSVLLYLTPELYDRLKALAEEDERSIQVTARRILEEHLGTKK